MNAVCAAALVFGLSFLAWAATFGVRGLLNDLSTPLKQLDGSPGGIRIADPPTCGAASPERTAVQRRRRVVLSASDLGTTLGPGWRMS